MFYRGLKRPPLTFDPNDRLTRDGTVAKRTVKPPPTPKSHRRIYRASRCSTRLPWLVTFRVPPVELIRRSATFEVADISTQVDRLEFDMVNPGAPTLPITAIWAE